MFKLNLKIAFRNLLKNKAYTLTNIMGLALGLAGFIFVLLYVNYEKSYDHWDDGLKNVYQVQEMNMWALKEGKKEWTGESEIRMSSIIKESLPNVAAITSLGYAYGTQSVIIDDKEPFLTDVRRTDRNFFSVFPYKFIYGNAASAFEDPQSIILKESFAKKYFGHINPVGKVIKLVEQSWTPVELYTVSGVIADPKTPTTMDFTLLALKRNYHLSDNFVYNTPTYVRITHVENLASLNNTLQKLYTPFSEGLIKKWQGSILDYTKNGLRPSIRLQPLYTLHQEPVYGESWLEMVKPIILLSSLLLVISIINFINMFTAQAVSRAKEVGIKKVIGASRLTLIIQFMLETAIQCFCALLIGIVFLELMLPYLNNLFDLSLTILNGSARLGLIIQLVILVVLITFLAGIYPALFLSAYLPHKVLKGNFGQGKKGSSFRKVLVGIQFVIAVAFFIGIMIVAIQLRYLEKRDPGFRTAGVININDSFNNRLFREIKKIDGVMLVGKNNGVVSRNQDMTGKYTYKGEVKELATVLVNLEGLQAINVQLLKGRLFDSVHAQDTLGAVILNESLERAYGGNMIGKFIYINDNVPQQVVGVIKDIQVSGFDIKILPTVYSASRDNATGYPNNGVNYLVKFDRNKQAKVLKELNVLWKREYPNFPFRYSYLQDDFQKLFSKHEQFSKMVKIFSFLSIVLSLIGLFSLASFMTRQRTKEIAIRKVMGADNRSIFLLLNKGYLWLMFAANVIAWPLIYILVNHWLSGFAYRIEMPVFPFFIAFGISSIVTVFTVSLQVRTAVKANPVNALKYE